MMHRPFMRPPAWMAGAAMLLPQAQILADEVLDGRWIVEGLVAQGDAEHRIIDTPDDHRRVTFTSDTLIEESATAQLYFPDGRIPFAITRHDAQGLDCLLSGPHPAVRRIEILKDGVMIGDASWPAWIKLRRVDGSRPSEAPSSELPEHLLPLQARMFTVRPRTLHESLQDGAQLELGLLFPARAIRIIAVRDMTCTSALTDTGEDLALPEPHQWQYVDGGIDPFSIIASVTSQVAEATVDLDLAMPSPKATRMTLHGTMTVLCETRPVPPLSIVLTSAWVGRRVPLLDSSLSATLESLEHDGITIACVIDPLHHALPWKVTYADGSVEPIVGYREEFATDETLEKIRCCAQPAGSTIAIRQWGSVVPVRLEYTLADLALRAPPPRLQPAPPSSDLSLHPGPSRGARADDF